MMLSSAAAWAVLRVEFPLGKNADAGWREPRDAGLEGEVEVLGEEDAVYDRENGLLEQLDGRAPVGLNGEGAEEAEAVRMGCCYCCWA